MCRVWVADVLSGNLLALTFAFSLVACSDSDSVSRADSHKEQPQDTAYIHDTLVVHDTIFVRDLDSLNTGDSTPVADSVHVVDSTRIIDSLHVVDSVRIVDSIRIADSLNVIDSIRIVDSVVVHDSVAVHDVEFYLGECTGDSAGVIKPATIGGKEKFFVCDEQTHLWREPAALDWNNLYVRESAVSAFVTIKTVMDELAEGEKVVAMLRHAERGDDYSSSGPLNDKGIEQAQTLGEKLQGYDGIYYAASPAFRTHQTCSNIAKGSGQADTTADTLEFLGGTWFVKDTVAYKKYKSDHDGSWNVTTKWLYEGSYADAFYDLAPRSTEYLDEYIIPAFERSGKRYGIFISHDLLIIPLVSYFSKNSIDLKYYSNKRWLNYLAGIAVVLKPDGTRRFYAVKGLDSGSMKN